MVMSRTVVIRVEGLLFFCSCLARNMRHIKSDLFHNQFSFLLRIIKPSALHLDHPPVSYCMYLLPDELVLVNAKETVQFKLSVFTEEKR